jgi:catechol 2,3-dioxygenase-like lactoylglutathione lyase family enzyme
MPPEVAMITGAHALIYVKDAEAVRAFFRDVLEFPYIDAGGGWLIFALPPAEMGIHPGEADPAHDHVYLMCDDVEKTVAELTRKGAEFDGTIVDQGWGLVIKLRLPGGDHIGLYQPKHPTVVSVAR